MEEFVKVVYFGTEFLVNKYGKVFRNGKEAKHFKDGDGYLRVSCNKNRSVGVHRLVALGFVPNDDIENKTEVNHKDFNRENPRWDNLEWVTHKDNVRYSRDNNRYKKDITGENNPNYGNNTLHFKYKNNPELAKEKQSRKGSKNGKAKSISLYDKGVFIKKFDYIGACCEYMINTYKLKVSINSLRATIRKCIKYNKLYKKRFSFK